MHFVGLFFVFIKDYSFSPFGKEDIDRHFQVVRGMITVTARGNRVTLYSLVVCKLHFFGRFCTPEEDQLSFNGLFLSAGLESAPVYSEERLDHPSLVK